MKPITANAFIKLYPFPELESNSYQDMMIDDVIYIRYRKDENGGKSIKVLSTLLDQHTDATNNKQVALASYTSWFNGSLYCRTFRREAFNQWVPDWLKNVESDSIFDTIYYKLNPLVMHHKNGKRMRGFAGHFNRRLQGFARSSNVTSDMLKSVVDEAYDEVRNVTNGEPSFEDITNYLFELYRINVNKLAQCFFTKTIGFKFRFNKAKISNLGDQYFQRHISPEDYGYRHVTSNYQSFWLKEYEAVVDDEVYDTRYDHIESCNSCGHNQLVSSLKNGRCLNCSGNQYQIHSYSYKVQDSLKPVTHNKNNIKKDIPYLGIELEYTTENEKLARRYIGDVFENHARMKHDGSIRGTGVEIVSRPATYEVHLPKYKSFLDNLPKEIKPHSSCGMHVHISRASLSTIGAGLIEEFCNREDNQSFIVKIAGRKPNNYASPNYSIDIKNILRYKKRLHDSYYGSRYNYVNNNNRDTVELRMFASPANYHEFVTRLQFVKALVEYSQPGQRLCSIKDSTSVPAFVDFVTKQGKRFKDLVTFMKGNKLCA